MRSSRRASRLATIGAAKDVPPGFAIQLRWPVDAPPIVRRDGRALHDGYGYLAQPLPPGDELLVWIRGGLTTDEVLSISVP